MAVFFLPNPVASIPLPFVQGVTSWRKEPARARVGKGSSKVRIEKETQRDLSLAFQES